MVMGGGRAAREDTASHQRGHPGGSPPGRSFVLVGDSVEQDPEVYAELYRRHPTQVRHIAIRVVSPGREARLPQVFAAVPRERWTVFEDPAALASVDLGAGR